MGQCANCRAHMPLGSAFCPSCGRSHQTGRPTNQSGRQYRGVSVNSTTLIFQIISVISSILFIIFVHSQGIDFNDFDLFGVFNEIDLGGTEELWIAYAVALVPTILVFAPQIVGALVFRGETDDARLNLIACASGLFIGLRSVSVFLLDSQIPNNGTLAGAMFAGLAGFGVVASTYPRNMATHEWVADDWKNIRILWGLIAAYFLIQTRTELFGEYMVFTATSIAGGSSTEVVQMALLVVLPFLKSPLRQSVAFTVGAFSLASWGGNMIMTSNTILGSNQLAWRPNPVITLCCLALIVPWEEFLSKEQTTF
jgi:hypothetical protein